MQDALVAVLFAAAWFGTTAYLGDHGWRPVRADGYRLAGVWTTAVLLLRRVAPLSVLVGTVIGYPLAYWAALPPIGPRATLQTEFHLLPILIAGYGAATRGRVRSALVAAAAMTGVLALTTWDSRGMVPIEWDRVVVNELAMASAVFLAALLQEQRQLSAELADRNRELEHLRAVEAQQAIATERTRIARELHDVVAHHITAVIVRAQAADRVSATDPAESTETLRWVASTAREVLTSMRQTVRVLRTPDGGQEAQRAPEPGLGDLDAIAGRMRVVGLDVSLHVGAALPPLDRQTELAIVRIAQEALTNTLRHAHASRAVVSCCAADGAVILDIEDDGDGRAPVPERVRGHGLIGMRERATSCGGSLQLGRSPLGGWRVRARLPLADGNATEP